MLLQKFLQTGGSPGALSRDLGIHVRQHKEFPRLTLFKYNQIESPMGDPLVRECRGVILDAEEDWRVICRPFDKFFNYGEGHAADIDWSTAQVQEKLDGSLATIYWFEGKWHVATSGTPDASGQVNDFGMTFKELFWKTFQENGYSVPSFRHVDLNFIFELCTPFNRVVVPHREASLTLIGVRNRFSGEEVKVGENTLGYKFARSFPLQNIEDVTNTFQQMDPLKQEGYVIVDAKFNRIKVKHPGYVAIHHIKGDQGPTPKRMLEVARSGEGTELLVHFPEWKPLYDDVKGKYEVLVAELEQAFDAATAATNAAVPPGVVVQPSWLQKEFATHACRTRCSDALFRRRAGKCESIRKYLVEMDLGKLTAILKLKEES